MKKKKPLTKYEQLIKRFSERIEKSVDNIKDKIMSLFFKNNAEKKIKKLKIN